ncbi:hypothetical protein DPMN_034493 [Dreissena polymorpha]|uniref:Uncharacterized protein n=1 Tax=Dreissena polymorpha TaxID=45954 RepID=A0A9D4M802_DREPO|nr:hypothetical protein DPMN_034493 [Dreissena polymorpha]
MAHSARPLCLTLVRSRSSVVTCTWSLPPSQTRRKCCLRYASHSRAGGSLIRSPWWSTNKSPQMT